MKAQDYIISTLEKLAEPVQLESVEAASLESAIFAKVMSKKFRKLKADDEAIRIVKGAIAHAIKSNSPIKINVIFGGNKLWRFEEAPEIDWAEVFCTIYFARWMKSIASVYEPGVYLEYYSEDVVLEAMNNLPKSETNQYTETFKNMLKWLEPYLPENIRFGYKRYGDEYANEEEFRAELEAAKTKVFKELGSKLPALNEQQCEATEMNVRLNPGQADDPLWREKAELIHQSIERTETMERYIGDTTFIPACPTYFPGCIATGSTKKSLAKFWVGVGALERNGDDFNETVLTPKQIVAADTWEKVHIPGLTGKNFSKIRVI